MQISDHSIFGFHAEIKFRLKSDIWPKFYAQFDTIDWSNFEKKSNFNQETLENKIKIHIFVELKLSMLYA